MRSGILVLILCVTSAGALKAQRASFELPTTNSRATIRQRIAATDVEVNYSRPARKGRAIFGRLIPFGHVWRTGSDASTKVRFSTPVSLNGQPLDSGSYELFTIPGETEWTIILQKNRSQWGSYAYQPSNDALRFTALPQSLTYSVETFTIGFDNVTSKSSELSLSWERTRVPINIGIDLSKTVIEPMEAMLQSSEKPPYFLAAMFYYENDLNIERAAELMTRAVQNNPRHVGMLYRLALILERKGDKKAAIEAAEKSLKEVQSLSAELKKEYTDLNTVLLARLKS